jgi:hypothetical protein
LANFEQNVYSFSLCALCGFFFHREPWGDGSLSHCQEENDDLQAEKTRGDGRHLRTREEDSLLEIVPNGIMLYRRERETSESSERGTGQDLYLHSSSLVMELFSCKVRS